MLPSKLLFKFLNRQKSISYQIFYLVSGGYFILVLALLLFKFQFQKNNVFDDIQKKMTELANEHTFIIGKSVLEKNNEHLKLYLKTLIKNSYISGVKISNTRKNQVMKEGDIKISIVNLQFPINLKVDKIKETVAYLNLYSNKKILFQKTKSSFLKSLIKMSFEFLFFTTFLFYFLKRTLKVPLEKMTAQLKNIKPKDLSEMKEIHSPINELNILRDTFNKMISKISNDRDIFEEKNETLKKMDLQKTDFFKNISIELQTPLGLIIEPLENLHQKFLEEKHFSTALKNSKKLYRLVEQLLDFQTLSLGNETQKNWPINVFHFLKQTHFLFQSIYSFEDIQFSLDLESLLNETSEDKSSKNGVFIRVNPESLEKIVFNFLSNALKFTGEGGKITLGGKRKGNKINIFVKDTGPGIPKDKQNDVFEIFKQLDPDPTSTFEGTGLGLALSKELTLKMKGNIGLKSDPGHGSEFYCEFDEIDYKKEELDILILEDELDTANTLEIILEKLPEVPKYKIALDSKQGRKILNDYQVKLIIADSRLPGEGGISFLKFASETQPQTKKILLTGDTDFDMLKNANNYAKVDAIIFKPWDEHFLLRNIEDLLQFFGPNLKRSHYVKSNEEIRKDKEGQDILDQGYQPQSEGNKNPLILVIDDLKDMRDLISKELSVQNFKVITRTNGLNGLEAARKFRPDLIITDWMMPIMNGPQMISNLKKDNELKNVPIIILTSKADDESRIKGIDIGADNYLSKPFKMQELLSNISNLIELKDNEKKLSNANIDLKEKQSAIQNLLENLGQGFLIFNEKGVILPGCSEITKVFFGVDPTHKYFHDIISLNEERKNTFSRWLKNLWKGNFSFKDMMPLAPKTYTEENKFIQLNYRPIYKDKKIEKVICIATDRTQERNLEKRTKAEKEKIQMILKILKDPIGFQNILDTAYTSINLFETELDKETQEIDLTYIFRKIHTLKALFASFSIPSIPSEMNKLENFLSIIQDKKSVLTRKLVKDLDLKIKSIFNSIDSFTKKNRLLIEQSNVKGNLGKKAMSTEDIIDFVHVIEADLTTSSPIYQNFIEEFILENISSNFIKLKERLETLAKSKNKSLNLIIETTNIKIRQDQYFSFFEMAPNLFNFLINYDLETPKEREILGKSESSNIKINFHKKGKDKLIILIQSDGKGIDEDKIHEYFKEDLHSNGDGEGPTPEILLRVFKSDYLHKILGKDISQETLGVHSFIEEIENLKGSIKIQSRSQEGLIFEIALPLLDIPL